VFWANGPCCVSVGLRCVLWSPVCVVIYKHFPVFCYCIWRMFFLLDIWKKQTLLLVPSAIPCHMGSLSCLPFAPALILLSPQSFQEAHFWNMCVCLHPLLHRVALREFFSQFVHISAISLTLVLQLALELVELPLDSCGLTSQVHPGPPSWRPFLLLYQLHHSVSSANLLRVHSIPLSLSLKDVEEHRSQDRLPGDSSCHQPPPGHRAIDYKPLAMAIQPIPYPLNSSPFKSISLQFRDKSVVRNCIKGLPQVQWHQLPFLCPPVLSFHRRRLWDWSGRTCLWWSCASLPLPHFHFLFFVFAP